MKFLYTLLVLSLFSFDSFSQEWTWAHAIKGGNGDVEIFQSTTDSQGNIFALGYFNNSITDITDESNIIITSGSTDIFLVKIDPEGNPIWMRFMQSAGRDAPAGLVVDIDDNLYVLGSFKDHDCSFLAPSGITTITNQGHNDIFIAKYQNNGDLTWAKNVSWGSSLNSPGSIKIDNSLERIIFSGWFRVDINFGDDFGNPTSTLTPLVNNGMFIANLDLDGNFISSYNFDLPTSNSYGNITYIQEYNNSYYLLGKMIDQVQFETTSLQTIGTTNQDAFIYKTDLNFNEQWVNRIHGTTTDLMSSFVVNDQGIYIGGHSKSPDITFETTSGTPITEALTGVYYDLITVKYDHAGVYQSNETYSGTGSNFLYSTSTTNNQIIFSGNFTNQLVLGSDTILSTTPSYNDVFWLVVDNDINPIYVDHTTGSANDRSATAFIDNNSNIYISGSYKSDPIYFNSDYGKDTTLNVATASFSDAFIAKHKLCSDFDVRIFDLNPSCPVANDGELTAIMFTDTSNTADTVFYNFDYLWSTSEITDTIQNLGIGEYTLEAVSEKGCTYRDTFELEHSPLLTTLLTEEVTLNCATDLYPTDTVFGFLGQRPYTYAWSGGLGTDSVITDIPVGTHYVTVTDACGTEVIDSIVVGHIPTLVSTISTHNTIIACANGNDGEAWMNTSNGFGTISYNWENSSSTDYIASDLPIGLHHVTVSDACISIIDSVNVVNLPSMNANISSSTPISCIGNTDGQAETFVVGGVQPYSYVWSSGETTATAGSLPEGMAYVTVSDACESIVDSIEITVEPLLQIQLSANDESCSSGNGSVSVEASNGSGVYSYAWDITYPLSGSPISTDATVSDLSADRYYVEVSDACGTKIDSIDLTTNTPLVAVLSAQTQILNCDTSTNGSVSVITNHGVLPYTYTWSTSASTGATASDLGVGVEYVTVSDQCGTVIIDSVNVVNLPAMNANISSSTPVSCSGNTDGMAETFVVGGVQPYSYNWSSGETTANAINLAEGVAFVTISDACNSVVQSVDISVETSMTIDVTAQHENCSGGDGSVSVEAENGSGTYSYAWDITYPISASPISTNPTVTNLSADRYYIQVTDDCGTKIDSIDLTTNATLVATLNSHSEILDCDTSTNGSVNVIASNGVLPYTYTWSTSSSTGASATDLQVGTEYVTITDQCGTEIIDSVVISYYPNLIAFAEFMDEANCDDSNDGQASVIATGGVQPYTFSWSNSSSTGTIADDLPSGMQYVTVSDYCGMTVDSVNISIQPSLNIQLFGVNETCSNSNGSVVVSPFNGSGAYSFAWDTSYPISATPISNNDTVNDLSAGRYYVEVSDDCGIKVDSIDITTNSVLEASLSSHSEILSCDTSSNGSVSVIATNGVLPYIYNWSTSASTGALATDLGVGTEYVTITDQCGTEIIDSIIIGYYPKLIAFAEFMNHANCVNTNDGKASVIATGGVQPYSFSWSNSTSTLNVAEDLAVGLQYVTVSDYCGEAIDSVEIGSLPALTVDLSSSALQCPGDSLGIITANTNYGVLPYTYNWGASSPENIEEIDSLWAGMHYVTVTDLCNVPLIDSIEIETTPTLNAYLTNHFVTVTCPSSSNGINEIIVTGGLAPYSYEWSNGVTTKIIENLNVGTHYATITDQCNVSEIDSVYVSHLPAMDVNILANDPLCNNDTNGTIEIEVTQGIHPVEIVWADFNNSNYTQSELLSGNYVFTVTDQCGSIIDSVFLDNPEVITIAGNVTDESSSVAMDGAIQTVVNGGISPYQFLWNNNEVSQDLVDIPAGIYILSVTDYNDCSSSQTFEVETKVVQIEPMEAFTPNSDGVNDVWEIRNISEFPEANIKIFNQWGNLVFESTGYDEPWDGTNNGSELSAAVYYYIIDLKDGLEAQTGSITLIR